MRKTIQLITTSRQQGKKRSKISQLYVYDIYKRNLGNELNIGKKNDILILFSVP